MPMVLKLARWVKAQGGAQAVAKKLGVSPHAVWVWLRGDGSPRVATIERIVKLSKGKLSHQGIVRETRRHL